MAGTRLRISIASILCCGICFWIKVILFLFHVHLFLSLPLLDYWLNNNVSIRWSQSCCFCCLLISKTPTMNLQLLLKVHEFAKHVMFFAVFLLLHVSFFAFSGLIEKGLVHYAGLWSNQQTLNHTVMDQPVCSSSYSKIWCLLINLLSFQSEMPMPFYRFSSYVLASKY